MDNALLTTHPLKRIINRHTLSLLLGRECQSAKWLGAVLPEYLLIEGQSSD